ncbi:MAG: phage protein GemA/Gp16 family protein [Rhodocyclaceae bacterium]
MASTAFVPSRADVRARLIRAVQTGRGKLKLDEDTYRDLLAAKSRGKRSAKDLSVAELEAVLKHMRASGFTPTKPAGAMPRERRRLDTSPEASKARALWLWLHQLGIVKDPSERALAAFARRISQVDALQWSQRPDKVIEGLKAFAARQLPQRLAARVESMRAAGTLPQQVTADALPALVSPTLNPAGFDALRAAWLHLDGMERSDARTG